MNVSSLTRIKHTRFHSDQDHTLAVNELGNHTLAVNELQ